MVGLAVGVEPPAAGWRARVAGVAAGVGPAGLAAADGPG
jgi:hypothetical protein